MLPRLLRTLILMLPCFAGAADFVIEDVDLGFEYGRGLSFALNGEEPAFSAYASNGSLIYAEMVDGNWVHSVVETESITYTSIGERIETSLVFLNGSPAIAYHHMRENGLRLAIRNGTDWQVFQISANDGSIPGEVGLFADSRVFESGELAICFYDESIDSLRLAKGTVGGAVSVETLASGGQWCSFMSDDKILFSQNGEVYLTEWVDGNWTTNTLGLSGSQPVGVVNEDGYIEVIAADEKTNWGNSGSTDGNLNFYEKAVQDEEAITYSVGYGAYPSAIGNFEYASRRLFYSALFGSSGTIEVLFNSTYTYINPFPGCLPEIRHVSYKKTSNGDRYVAYSVNLYNCYGEEKHLVQIAMLPAPYLPELPVEAFYESNSGEPLTIDATPTAGFPSEFTYQWRFNGGIISYANGGTAPSYTINGEALNEGTWSVTVTNLAGSVTHEFEYRVFSDTDSDGLSDYREQEILLTDPQNADSDGDGLEDGEEVLVHLSNPSNSDSDGDLISDGIEVEGIPFGFSVLEDSTAALNDLKQFFAAVPVAVSEMRRISTLSEAGAFAVFATDETGTISFSAQLESSTDLKNWSTDGALQALTLTTDTTYTHVRIGPHATAFSYPPYGNGVDGDADGLEDAIEANWVGFGLNPQTDSTVTITALKALFAQLPVSLSESVPVQSVLNGNPILEFDARLTGTPQLMLRIDSYSASGEPLGISPSRMQLELTDPSQRPLFYRIRVEE